jgi:geranylgeranyl diphosphate synthase type II
MLHLIEERLKNLIPEKESALFQAARYSLLAEGKRLRPQLVLISAKAFGADVQAALDPACAIEMIHTYSLIHDDLPCMDDDDLRRGLPSLHKVYGEGMALLAGDYLLTYAFEVLAQAQFLSAEQKIELIQTLSQAAGAKGMIGGQAIDLASEGKRIDEAVLETMHIGKTAALLTACLEFGAILGRADKETKQQLRYIGRDIGLAYQILDDILDETGTTQELGKKAGADAIKNKPNAVSIYGLQGAQLKLQDLKIACFEKLFSFSTELQVFLQQLFERKK